jgi:hypothetical protein
MRSLNNRIVSWHQKGEIMLSLPPTSSFSSFETQNSGRFRGESDRQGINQSQGQEGVKPQPGPSARFASVEQTAKAPNSNPSPKPDDQSKSLPPLPSQGMGLDQLLSLQAPPPPSFAEIDTDQDGTIKEDELTSFAKSIKQPGGEEMAKSIFKAMDTDEDGSVTGDEKTAFDNQRGEGVVIRSNQIRPEALDQGIRAFQLATNQGLQQSFARQSGLKV